jgi:hypothetical protein
MTLNLNPWRQAMESACTRQGIRTRNQRPGGCDVGYRQIPVSQQDLEAPLLFAFVGLLVGPQLPDHALFIGIGGGGRGRVLEPDGDAIIPAGFLGHVIGGGFDLH